MTEPLADQIIRKIDQASNLYHRLVLVVAPSGAGKTSALQEVCERKNVPKVNVNLELSHQMLNLTEHQRTRQLSDLLHGLVSKSEDEVVLLDNIEILFDVSLKQDPLRLLQGLSRSRIIVAAWNGIIDRDHLLYAVPEHPEYRNYMLHDFLVVTSDITK